MLNVISIIINLQRFSVLPSLQNSKASGLSGPYKILVSNKINLPAINSVLNITKNIVASQTFTVNTKVFSAPKTDNMFS